MSPWNNWNTEFNDKAPIYSQIITLFSRSFVKGEIQPGERIPSIRDMALALKVNANTMQRVYQEMERGGFIVAKRGTGYFFTEDNTMIEKAGSRMAQESIGRFLEEMHAIGYSDKRIIDELTRLMEGGNNNAAAANKGN